MKFLWFSITEWIALLSFVGAGVFAFAKVYNLLQSLQDTIKRQNEILDRLDNKYDDHEIRIVRLEEQNKTIFKNYGGKKWKLR